MSDYTVTTETVSFLSDGLRLSGIVTRPEVPRASPGVIFLHGGSIYGKSVYPDSQYDLSKNGYSTLAFDFRGVGESDGSFESGTLNRRVLDAQNALEYFIGLSFVDSSRFCVIGSSMGAHIAARLTEYLPSISALYLVAGAAYGTGAEDKLLNEEFTRAIRKPNSWNDSPVFSALNDYAGSIGVVYGEEDDIIPIEIQEKYGTLVSAAQYFVRIKYGKHQMLRPKNEVEEKAKKELFIHRLSFLREVLE